MGERQYLDNESDLMDYIKVIILRKKPILIIFFLSIIVATIISFSMPKVYETSTIIKIGTVSTGYNISTLLFLKKENIQELQAETYGSIIKKLNLNIDESTFRKMIEVEDIMNTNFIKIKIRYMDPQLAIKICNTIADFFVQQGNEILEKKLSPIKEEIVNLEKRSEIIEKEISRLKQIISSQKPNSDVFILQNGLSNYEILLFNLGEKTYSLKQVLIDSQEFEIFIPATISQNVKPNKRLIITASAILGLMIGIFAVFLQELMRKN